MRKLFILFALAALSACVHDQPGIEVRTVPVPTPVPCVKASDVPAEPASVQSQLTGDQGHDIGTIAGSALDLRIWGRSLRALIVPGCTIVAH